MNTPNNLSTTELQSRLIQLAKSTTGKLALSYLAIIMTMSVGFSVVFYHTSVHELNRPAPQRVSLVEVVESGQSLEDFLANRAAQGRHRLLANLVLVNVAALAGGTCLSYYLARRTLTPIEAAMEAQSRFTSDASHELRTPLATIQAENEVALRNPDLTLARAKQLLRSNLEESYKLKALSDGLLQLSQAENQATPLRPVSLGMIATDALNSVIKPAQDKHITIEDTVPDLSVHGDARLLTQALVILLDNAIKYSPAGSTVYLSAKPSGKQVAITVRDHGPGISATDQLHIFDRFYRADQSRTKQQVSGYGLGLSIAKKIVTQLGGSLTVTSQPGKGAAFSIYLPL
jgi:signal transduction histidine kinase